MPGHWEEVKTSPPDLRREKDHGIILRWLEGNDHGIRPSIHDLQLLGYEVYRLGERVSPPAAPLARRWVEKKET